MIHGHSKIWSKFQNPLNLENMFCPSVGILNKLHKFGTHVLILKLSNWNSDGSGPRPGPGPARSPGFLESPRPDIGRRAQDWARPETVVKSPGAQRALGI